MDLIQTCFVDQMSAAVNETSLVVNVLDSLPAYTILELQSNFD